GASGEPDVRGSDHRGLGMVGNLVVVKPRSAVPRLLASAFVIASIAIVLRVTVAQPVVAASAATVLALGVLATGLWMHGRGHRRTWRTAWALLALSLAVQAVSTAWVTISAPTSTYPDAHVWIGVVCALVAACALGILLSTRARGRAIDAALEGAIISGTL